LLKIAGGAQSDIEGPANQQHQTEQHGQRAKQAVFFANGGIHKIGMHHRNGRR
jgi:hypothetical protein